jgi:hypothetical protein
MTSPLYIYYQINATAIFANGTQAMGIVLVANIEGVTSKDIGMIDYFAGTSTNDTQDEAYVTTNPSRYLIPHLTPVCFAKILDAKEEESCFYFVFYTGSPNMFIKSKRSKPLCFHIHKYDNYKMKFPKYFTYNSQFSLRATFQREISPVPIYKYTIETVEATSKSTNASVGGNYNNYLLGKTISYGFELIATTSLSNLNVVNQLMILEDSFKLTWIGPINIDSVIFRIYTPLYSNAQLISGPIQIITQPNIIISYSPLRVLNIYISEQFPIYANANYFNSPVNNAQIKIYVQNFFSSNSLTSSPLLAIYMMLAGIDKIYDFISSSDCKLNVNTTSVYSTSNGNATFWTYFEEGKNGIYTISARYGTITNELVIVKLYNKISKVVIANNISQTLKKHFAQNNGKIMSTVFDLSALPVVQVLDYGNTSILNLENRIKIYIFNHDDVVDILSKKGISDTNYRKVSLSDFQTNFGNTNSTIEKICISVT